MTRFKFVGASCNLGAHGFVAQNSYVYLSDAELLNISGDTRFVVAESTGGSRLVEIAFDLVGIPVAATAVQSIHVPCALFLTEIIATLGTPHPSTGLTIGIKKNGVTIFSTNPTIDANETSTATAAIPAVLSDDSLAEGDLLTLDIISAPATNGSSIAGDLRVVLRGTSPDAKIRYTRQTANPDSVGGEMIRAATGQP